MSLPIINQTVAGAVPDQKVLLIGMEELIKKVLVITAGLQIQVIEVNLLVIIQEVITDLHLLHPDHLRQVTGAGHRVQEAALQG